MKKRTAVFGWAVLLATLLVSCIKSETGGIRPAAICIEGTEWQLVEVSGMPVSPLAGEKRPFMKFDAAKKEATGFAGCNNFFGGYELDGSSLKFGPIGATRMACPDLQMSLETEFLKTLEKNRTWDIPENVLLLLDDDSEVLARFTIVRGDTAGVDLESMTFLSSWLPAGRVTLSHAAYREPAAPGSASNIVVSLSDKRVFGLIQGKETGAVVLVTDPGGSGTFYDLALLSKEAEGWVNTDTLFLGDRVKVHSLEVENNDIVIAMATHGPDDPMCCPTLKVKKRVAVQGNRLVISAEGEKTGEPQITGTVWEWMQTLYNDDRKVVPPDPKNYTVQFGEDGTLNVKADCNQKGGTYTYSPEEKRLSLEITHSTMASCPEGSLEDEFVRGLSAAAIYFIKQDDLYIDLIYDTGTMGFSEQKGN